MRENSLKNIITDLDMKITHMEDTIMDYRDILIKLVKQNNQIVKFLKDFAKDVEYEYESEYGLNQATNFVKNELRGGKYKNIKEIIDNYLDKNKELEEFEKELKKNKDKLTPGQVGES